MKKAIARSTETRDSSGRSCVKEKCPPSRRASTSVSRASANQLIKSIVLAIKTAPLLLLQSPRRS